MVSPSAYARPEPSRLTSKIFSMHIHSEYYMLWSSSLEPHWWPVAAGRGGQMPTPSGTPGQSKGSTSPSSPLAPDLRWRQVFPGHERELSNMRRWLSLLLPDCPARDNVLSVATELGSNAIQHTASGQGGSFTVEITWRPSTAQVAVADFGSPAEPHVIDEPAGERGRGLLLVRGLSVRTGHTGDQRGRLYGHRSPGTAPAPPSRRRHRTPTRRRSATVRPRWPGGSLACPHGSGVPPWPGGHWPERTGWCPRRRHGSWPGCYTGCWTPPPRQSLQPQGRLTPAPKNPPSSPAGDQVPWAGPPRPGGPPTPPETAGADPAPQMAGSRRAATARHSSLSC